MVNTFKLDHDEKSKKKQFHIPNNLCKISKCGLSSKKLRNKLQLSSISLIHLLKGILYVKINNKFFYIAKRSHTVASVSKLIWKK